MKLLLINPPVTNVLEPWTDEPEYVRTALAHLAGYLNDYNAVDIRILDAKYEQLSFHEVVAVVDEFKPDMVGLTAFTSEIKPAAYQASLIKKLNPNITIVIGGVHITTLPIETMQEFSFFDIGVVGEGEITLKELCDYQLGKTKLEEIRGVVFRDGKEIIKTKPRANIIDQDSLPMPAWHLLPKAKMYYIQTERGCPFNCQFCVNHNGRVARKRSAEKVIEEFKLLIKLAHPEYINIGDEIFTVDMPRANHIMELMIENNIHNQVKWDVQTHVKYIDRGLMKQFNRAKIYELHMGVEAGDEISLKNLGKGNTKETIMRAFKLAQEEKVKTGAFFILGHPNETVKSMYNTIKFAAKVNPDVPMFSIMVAYPGTEIARLAARKEGGFASISTNWDDYRFRIGGSIEYQNFSKRKLEWMLIQGYLWVFIRNFRVLDLLKFFLKYRAAAYSLLVKLLKGNKYVSDFRPPSEDYLKTFSTNYQLSSEEMQQSKTNFSKIQVDEMKRVKKSNPELIKEQQYASIGD